MSAGTKRPWKLSRLNGKLSADGRIGTSAVLSVVDGRSGGRHAGGHSHRLLEGARVRDTLSGDVEQSRAPVWW
jgi:hypothetical protein